MKIFLYAESQNLLPKNVDSLIECEKAELADLQHKLDNLYKHKAEGAFIRSRRKWFEEGEQNSAYFFRLEREQAKINQIKKLMVDGNITDDPRNIAKFFAKFYSDLYTSKLSPTHMNDLFQTCKICSVGGPPGTGWEPLLYSIFKTWFCMEPYKKMSAIVTSRRTLFWYSLEPFF